VERWPVPLEGPGRERVVSRSGLPESLTDRELSVLRWLTTMMSVAEIADELCVSTNTVKTHVAAVYRKLGVAKRRDAVSRGRELRLL
jgi:LuxR family maltose regulon positive regulatory protein